MLSQKIDCLYVYFEYGSQLPLHVEQMAMTSLLDGFGGPNSPCPLNQYSLPPLQEHYVDAFGVFFFYNNYTYNYKKNGFNLIQILILTMQSAIKFI